MRLLDLRVGDEIEVTHYRENVQMGDVRDALKKRYRIERVPYGSSLSSPRFGGFQDEEVFLHLKEVEEVLSDVRTVDGRVGSRAKEEGS